ncbi:MAG: SCP-2 sterol transfer family protein [Candidatus Lokiarchaeum sp. GC14_75]|nr:MAG: SCP-2 sterol transfer family protein [Candidatus Lokiarchaeum sp. GC14_75]
MSLECNNCGRKIETVSQQCGQSTTINIETNKMECDMGRCGVISFDKILCENCCINSSIMEIFYGFERLSKSNLEFREELDELKTTVIQIKLENPDFAYWVEFGSGKFKVGKGETTRATINFSSSQKIWSDILAGRSVSFIEFFKGNLKIEGDLQYAVVYLDLLELASEINQEVGVVNNE